MKKVSMAVLLMWSMAMAASAKQTAVKPMTLLVHGKLSIITPDPLPEAVEAENYSIQLAADGGKLPHSWRAVKCEKRQPDGSWAACAGSSFLPSGLNFSGSGVLSGTPVERGEYRLTIQVQDGM